MDYESNSNLQERWLSRVITQRNSRTLLLSKLDAQPNERVEHRCEAQGYNHRAVSLMRTLAQLRTE
ncbi:MAG: hypothetical protein SNJ29_10805, partial [Rikenellaceae bacterium]